MDCRYLFESSHSHSINIVDNQNKSCVVSDPTLPSVYPISIKLGTLRFSNQLDLTLLKVQHPSCKHLLTEIRHMMSFSIHQTTKFLNLIKLILDDYLLNQAFKFNSSSN